MPHYVRGKSVALFLSARIIYFRNAWLKPMLGLIVNLKLSELHGHIHTSNFELLNAETESTD